jgi:hypothetical protein
MATSDFTLAAGMTVVVQPNVVTRDGRAGVQTGELLLVTERGPERLHTFPRGLQQAGLTRGRRPVVAGCRWSAAGGRFILRKLGGKQDNPASSKNVVVHKSFPQKP